MIYRAIQLIQIFLADGRTDGLTKVIQEVLADLKMIFPNTGIQMRSWWTDFCTCTQVDIFLSLPEIRFGFSFQGNSLILLLLQRCSCNFFLVWFTWLVQYEVNLKSRGPLGRNTKNQQEIQKLQEKIQYIVGRNPKISGRNSKILGRN